jgi:excisionase family DNA binding protein
MEGAAKAETKKVGEDSPLLKTDEAAEFLRLSPATLEQDRVTKRMRIPFRRLGRAVRYHKRDLERWLDQQLVSEVA